MVLRARSLGLAGAPLVILLLASRAMAQPASLPDPSEHPVPALAESERTPDALEPAEGKPHELERPWLYTDDPSIPAPLHVVANLANTYSGNDRSTSRAFASQDEGPGGKMALGAQIALAEVFAVDLAGVLGGFGSSVGGGVMAGLRVAPFAAAEHGFRMAIASGYLLDLDRTSGMYGRVNASYDFGPVRLATTVHGEHLFRAVTDPLDVYLTTGLSVKVVPEFRIGAEYIAQDLEEAFADEDDEGEAGVAEGGAHQFVGLTAGVTLLDGDLQMAFGPALALNYDTGVKPVGRADVSYTF